MKTEAPALLITGPLEAAIHAFLRGLAFAPCYLPDTVAHAEARGTAEGCEWLEPAEVDAVNDLVARHTGDYESDPADWPAWTDAARFEPAPLPAICGGAPDDDVPPSEAEPFEPSERDRIDWARELARLDAEDAGWPAPDPDRVTDEDLARVGAVG